MGGSVEIVPAQPIHAVALEASGIRQDDVDEWVGGLGSPVGPALIDALTIPGSKNETMLRDGVVLCMWGTHPTGLDGVGQVWLIASRSAERHVLSIHRNFKAVLADMHSRFPVLLAYTHSRNALHHKWMERNGFEAVGGMVTVMGLTYKAYLRKVT